MINIQPLHVAGSQNHVEKSWCGRKSMRNAEKALLLENKMFEWRSRHLIIILTLSYKPEFKHLVTLDVIRQHRDRLLNNCRSNQLLGGIDGYVWKIEEGNNTGGLHLHFVFFYSSEHRADIHLARCIGEYWVNVITQGAGEYWNSNANKGLHAKYGHGVGTGQIDRHDLAKREALRENLLYLAKDDQQVSSKGGNPHLRMFGTCMDP